MSDEESSNNVEEKVRKRKKNRNIFQRFLKSHPGDYFAFKFPFGAAFGAVMGYGYYKSLFAGAFQEDERSLDYVVFGLLIFVTSLACAYSVQCRCIGMLCLPTMVGKSGKGLLKALLTAWILAGPIANILNNINISIHSMTCVAKMHSQQMQELVHLLHAPVSEGLKQIVNDTAMMNDTELIIKLNLKRLKAELWAKPREARDVSKQLEDIVLARERRNAEMKSYIDKLKDINFKEPSNPAQKLHDDAHNRCIKLFESGVVECKRLMKEKEMECRKTISIPFIGFLICLIFKATFVCNIVQYFDSWCGEIPSIDKVQINQDYRALGSIENRLQSEFRTEMLWKVPIDEDEEPVVLTVEEVTDRIERDMTLKLLYFQFFVAVIKKIIAISFILVIQAAKSYNTSFLTDFRFDNVYVTSYFSRKDKERKLQGKRCLLPLTKMEKRNVLSSFTLKLTIVEKKAIFYKLLKITLEAVFTAVIFFFDYVIFYILDLIRKHARTEMSIRGRHVLEVDIDGEGMVAILLRRLFVPFKDNKHIIESNRSNLECLPQAEALPQTTYISIYGMYVVFYLLIFFDAYALRLRPMIAGFAYRRRQKKRIIFLYSDLMRRRKNHLAHVRLTVKKLSRKYRLKQRYSFTQAMRLSWPQLEFLFKLFGFGSRRCIICEDKESKTRPMIECRRRKCHMNYCALCWMEVGERCWACDQIEPEPSPLEPFNDDAEFDENYETDEDDDDF